jgi:hypothetical protein
MSLSQPFDVLWLRIEDVGPKHKLAKSLPLLQSISIYMFKLFESFTALGEMAV